MPFTDTRLGPGTLLLTVPAGGPGPGAEYGFQVSAVTITPSFSTTAGTPTLAVPSPPDESDTAFALDGSAINDFTDPAGLSRFAFDNDGQQVDFEWTPVTADGTQVTGTVLMQAFPMGGKVGEQLVTDFSWPITGKPVFSGDLPLATGAGAGKKGAAA